MLANTVPSSPYAHKTAHCHRLHNHAQKFHSCRPQHKYRLVMAAAQRAATPLSEVDVVVVGSGIIGLLVARQLLISTQLSVALFDEKQPCAGATGAGQGYIWMAHRDPSSPGWALARHSKALWEEIASGRQQQHTSSALQEALEWQANGSLLLATTDAEVLQLQQRAQMLQQQGVPGVVLLSPREMLMLEPALQMPPGSRGLLVKSDAQINGKRAAFALLDECQQLGAAAASGTSSSSRLLVGLQEGVQQLTSLGPGGGVEVTTSHRRVRARHGVVVAAGVWSGQLLSAATGQPAWQQLLQPRRGHLLEMDLPEGMPPIHTGMMELSYTQHYSTAAAGHDAHSPPAATEALSCRDSSSSGDVGGGAPVDITFTATASASGSLLIGSSREFSGWESVPSSTIISAILQRASMFLPQLSAVQANSILSTTRVGLRPCALGGLPAIGPVPGLPNVVVAAGHEGSGLCLGPATAQIVMHHLLADVEDAPQATGELLEATKELLPENRLGAIGVSNV